MRSLFITATDTDAGKTYISTLLLRGLQALKMQAVGLKPIAAGADADGFNSDARQLQACSSISLSYAEVNPILFQQPVAPHLAAKTEPVRLNMDLLDAQLAASAHYPCQIRLIEGAGGWLLPLDQHLYLADWVLQHDLPVLLVVGMKLGCLNHAVLTSRELQRSNANVVGWVANAVDPEMLLLEANIADLQQRLPWPCLAVIGHQQQDSATATALAKAVLQQLDKS